MPLLDVRVHNPVKHEHLAICLKYPFYTQQVSCILCLLCITLCTDIDLLNWMVNFVKQVRFSLNWQATRKLFVTCWTFWPTKLWSFVGHFSTVTIIFINKYLSAYFPTGHYVIFKIRQTCPTDFGKPTIGRVMWLMTLDFSKLGASQASGKYVYHGHFQQELTCVAVHTIQAVYIGRSRLSSLERSHPVLSNRKYNWILLKMG